MTCGIADDGTLTFNDASGEPISEHLVEVAKKQNREAILGLIQRKCDEINGEIEALGRLHHDTPDARVNPRFVAPAFGKSEPSPPQPRALGWLDKLISSRRRRVEDANRVAVEDYQQDRAKWRQAKAEFDAHMTRRKVLVETLIYEDAGAMETFLEDSLQDIAWPRETQVATDIRDDGARVMLDVDLPELEDMPTKKLSVNSTLSFRAASHAVIGRRYG